MRLIVEYLAIKSLSIAIKHAEIFENKLVGKL